MPAATLPTIATICDKPDGAEFEKPGVTSGVRAVGDVGVDNWVPVTSG